MKAAVIQKYGGPEVLEIEEVEKPMPKDNEVLVKVHASCLTRASAMMRTGKPRFARLFLGFKRPKHPIPGSGYAGVVVAKGKQVVGYEIGDAVFGETAASFGTNAEYVCVPIDGVALPMPDHLSFEQAALVCDGPVTSYNFLKNLANVQPGQKVLVNGASGSLGVAAVQIAKYMGAEVTGVCSTGNVELVRSLGADHVIDYKQEDYTEGEQQYDVVYDTVGLSCFRKARKVMTKQGQYLSPVLNAKTLFAVLTNWTRMGGQKAKFDATGLRPAKDVHEMIAGLLKMMKVVDYDMVLERRYKLDEIREAHKYIDTGRKRGNIVLSIS